MQRREGCWWFGKPDLCNTYTVLQVAMWICTVLHIVSVSVANLAFSGTQGGHKLHRCGYCLMSANFMHLN